MNQDGLAIGVLASSIQQLSELNRLVKGAGHRVAASIEMKPELLPTLPAADVWVVNLDMHDVNAQAVINQLDLAGLPVIYEDDVQPTDASGKGLQHSESRAFPADVRAQQERRIALKIRQLVREPSAANVPEERKRAQKVWVLAASTGGPEAVAEFLEGIPENLDGAAFFYVQHIEHQAMESLRRVVARRSSWALQNTDETRVIRERTVYLVSPQHQFELLECGVLSPLDEPWGGRFRPSIDQVIAKVARVYSHRGGAIVFTGMGDDGAKSCNLLHHRGGQVWVQTAATCTVDSMPRSVEKTGCAHFSGCPNELAKRFVSFHRSSAAPHIPPVSGEPAKI